MGTEIKKLVIDRSRWLRGEGSDASALYRPRSGKMCCLGFFGLACGLSTDDMADKKEPSNTTVNAWPGWLRGERFRLAHDDAGELMDRNDRDPDETVIAGIFAAHGVEVEFIDGPPDAPSHSEKQTPATKGKIK